MMKHYAPIYLNFLFFTDFYRKKPNVNRRSQDLNKSLEIEQNIFKRPFVNIRKVKSQLLNKLSSFIYAQVSKDPNRLGLKLYLIVYKVK